MSELLDQLRVSFGDRFTASTSRLEPYRRDEAYHVGPLAAGLVLPRSTSEVVEIVRLCAAAGVPLVPYGAGTSLEGNAIAIGEAIIVDLREMNAIKTVNAEDLDCICEPGVTREELNRYLRDTGLCFPIDPGANATLGGMVATGASGTTAVRYGTMKENVVALEVVLADGSVVRTGRRPRKTAAGYDLTHLFTGSEGTLGIITEITLRLHGIPECVRSAACTFETLDDAVGAVIVIIQLGIPVARIELMDDGQVEACNNYSGVTRPVAPTLLFDFHGSPVETADHLDRVSSVLSDFRASNLAIVATEADRAALWKARHAALPAARALRPNAEVLITDVAVPISRLADCISETRAEIDETAAVATIVGHVGDGNFHVFFVLDPNDGDEVAMVQRLHENLVERALSMEGTCSGEHGIGIGKIDFLTAEIGLPAVNVMRQIKLALDPKGILNPGKIFKP